MWSCCGGYTSSLFCLLRSTPGSTTLGPAYTSILASTGQSLEYLASADPSSFVALVKGVPQALQDSITDMEMSSSKRAPCDLPYFSSKHSLSNSPNCLQLLYRASAASYALNCDFAPEFVFSPSSQSRTGSLYLSCLLSFSWLFLIIEFIVNKIRLPRNASTVSH